MFALAWIAATLCTVWAIGALYFDFPNAGAFAAILFSIALLAMLIFVRRKLLKLAIIFGAFAIVLSWWLTLKPRNDRAWQPNVAQTAWAEINDDEITIHNVRNCDYHTQTDFAPHWKHAQCGFRRSPAWTQLLITGVPPGSRIPS